MSTTVGESIIVFGFPGVGKTYAFEHQEELELNIVDSDSSKFHWLYKDDECTEYVLDEDGKKIPHPAWPANYTQYIELIGREQEIKPDYILVSTHDEVMKALMPMNFTSFTVVPDVSLKEKYLELYKQRGSSEEFVQMMDKNFEKFVESCTANALSDENSANMLIPIREGGKIQNICDLLKLKIGIPMEFNEI